jgi:hypothetical protein
VITQRLTGAILLLGLLGVTGCGGKNAEPPPQPLSARARESALAKSGLPGATGIGSALRVSDSSAARQRRVDSIASAVP